MSTAALVSCPCIYCKGKHVSRYIRRHHMSRKFTSQGQTKGNIVISSPLDARDNNEVDTISEHFTVNDTDVECSIHVNQDDPAAGNYTYLDIHAVAIYS